VVAVQTTVRSRIRWAVQQGDLASAHRQDSGHAGLAVGAVAVSWKRLLPHPDRACKIREIRAKRRRGSGLTEGWLRGILVMSQTGSQSRRSCR
jgi:hypothetical protein